MTGLFIILFLVLILPFAVKVVERNLEVFLFIMGIAASIVGGAFSKNLLVQALLDPIKITLAVIVAGLLFKWFKEPLSNGIQKVVRILPFPLFIFLTVTILGFLSSVITAIIAALVLVLIISKIQLSRKSKLLFVVFSCFSIGLGAALTPVGEPLSTITTSKLNEEFFYIFSLVGPFVVPTVLLLGIVAAFIIKPGKKLISKSEEDDETYEDIIVRGLKIYFFVMGLTMLGAGFEPLINKYLLGFSSLLLYWVNMISAVLDNATLAAAEISPEMSRMDIQAILLGLLVSGGMLIPGNIPNIIAAGKLNISSREWAAYGIPLGLVIMIVYFLFLIL